MVVQCEEQPARFERSSSQIAGRPAAVAAHLQERTLSGDRRCMPVERPALVWRHEAAGGVGVCQHLGGTFGDGAGFGHPQDPVALSPRSGLSPHMTWWKTM